MLKTVIVVVGLLSAMALGASSAAVAGPPSDAASQAVGILNSRYREPLGLADVTWDSAVADAAQNHANYWADGNPFGHEETPGAPGFTGQMPWDRCQAVGAPPCGEVAFPELGVVDSMNGWMNTPYHGGGLISSGVIGCGTSTGGTDCDLVGQTSPNVTGTTSPANAADSPVRIWPFDGATGVPVSWWGSETPSPLANYSGDSNNTGPTLFFFIASSSAQIAMTGPAGQHIKLIAPGATTSSDPLTVTPPSSGAWYEALPAETLSGTTRYTLLVTTADGLTRSVTFSTTAVSPPPASNSGTGSGGGTSGGGSGGSTGNRGGGRSHQQERYLRIGSIRISGHHVRVGVVAQRGAKLSCSMVSRVGYRWPQDHFRQCWPTTVYPYVSRGLWRLRVHSGRLQQTVYLRVR